MDIVLTVLGVLIQLGASYATLVMAVFSPMLGDSCQQGCDMGVVDGAMYAMLLAVPLAALVASAGVIWSACTRRFMFPWPLAASGALVLIAVLGLNAMSWAVGG